MCEEFVCRYMCKDNLLKILTTLYLRKLNSIILHFGYVPKSKELIDCEVSHAEQCISYTRYGD